MDSYMVVGFAMASPYIPGRRPTLDGLLANLLAPMGGDLNAGVEKVPLERRDGVFLTSQAFIEKPFARVAVTRQGSLYTALLRHPGIERQIAPNPKAATSKKLRAYPFVRNDKEDYKNFMTTSAAYTTPRVWFTGYGDAVAVRRILWGIPAIGSQRTSGMGKVKDVIVYTPDVEPRYPGWVDFGGNVVRPIPESIACGLDLVEGTYFRQHEACMPPYWKSPKIACFTPLTQFIGGRDVGHLLFDGENPIEVANVA